MSEPLRAIFHQNTLMIFKKDCQCKIKILNFCLWYFDKILLSKCDIFFKFIMLIAKTGLKKKHFFSKFWTLKKTNTCFKRPMKELKTVL